jgi:hypothetical protein
MQKKIAPQSFSTFQNNQPEISSPLVSTVTSQGNSLKIISWNIFMLPRFIMRTGQLKRAYEIVNVLKHEDADIIIFQEAFDTKVQYLLYL